MAFFVTKNVVTTLVGGGFLLGQLAWLVYERTRPSRYLCWAPNDYVTDYQLEVHARGRQLDDEEVLVRYGWQRQGRFENVPQHLLDIVQQYEQTYGAEDAANVRLTYRVNNGPQHVWQWPAAD